jgi:peptidoglycan/LPS O-acetylase OafA/YrhL
MVDVEANVTKHFQSGSSQRLAFADLLRGLAALTVVLGHFTVLFLQRPKIVAALTMAEPGQAVSFPAWIDRAYDIFNLASIGVAVFFLISGFVIPLSLEGSSVRSYLAKRFLRIFPTYWVAFVIGVAALFVSGAFWSKPVTYDLTDYFANTFLLADFFGRYDILSVMWTLQIEIKFYLLAPIFYAALSRGSLRRALLWGAGMVVLYWFAATSCGKGVEECWNHYRFSSRMVLREGMFISYMLIGSVLYAHYRRLITNGQAAFGVVFLFGSFLLSGPFSPFPDLASAYYLPFFWGLAIFLPCYLLRSRIGLAPPFRFLANISYPLYVVHPLVGYVTMRLLITAGLSYPPAFVAALLFVGAIAFAIHTYVEAPTIALGKRLAKTLAESAPIEGARPYEEPKILVPQTVAAVHEGDLTPPE